MAKYLREEYNDLNEVTSDNDDDKDDADDDDGANSKDVEAVEIDTGGTNNVWEVSKPEITAKGGNKLSCYHERQIKGDKSAEKKSKPYQWLFYVRIKFIW